MVLFVRTCNICLWCNDIFHNTWISILPVVWYKKKYIWLQSMGMSHRSSTWYTSYKSNRWNWIRLFLETTSSRSVIRYWHPSKPKIIRFCTTARFIEYEILDPNGELSPVFKITQVFPQDQDMEITKVSDQGNPLIKNPIKIMKIKFPPKEKAIGL